MKPITPKRSFLALAFFAALALWWLWPNSAAPDTPTVPARIVASPRASSNTPVFPLPSAAQVAPNSTRALIQPPTQPPPAGPSPSVATPAKSTPANGFGNLRFATGPADGAAAVMAKIGAFPIIVVSAGGSADPNRTEVMPPLAFYRLQYLYQITGGAGLEVAKPSGFAYVVADSGQQVTIVTVQVNAAGKTTTNQSFSNTGVPVLAGLLEVAAKDQINSGSYEARALMLPTGPPLGGSPRLVIWLKSDTAGGDLIYPLDADKLPKIQAGKLYSVDGFLNTLYPQRLKAHQAAATP